MFVLAANHAEKCLVCDVVGGKKMKLDRIYTQE